MPEKEKNKFEELITKGVNLFRLEKYEDAIACFDKVPENDANYTSAQLNEGGALERLGKYENAIACFDKVPENDTNYTSAQLNKGVALFSLGKYADAIVCFDEIPSTDTNYTPAQINKGIALFRLGKYADAIACFKVPKGDADYTKAQLGKGVILGMLKSHVKAITCFNKIPESDPIYTSAQLSKGVALGMLKRHTEAITCFNKIPSTDTNYTSAQLNKGIALFRLGKYADAIACFKVPKGDTDYTKAQFNKGVALVRLGKSDEAIACFDKINLKVFNILSIEMDSEFKKQVIGLMLEADFKKEASSEVFSQILKEHKGRDSDGTKFEQLKEIYVQSLMIISLLHVTDKREEEVAYYTPISTAQLLLFNNKQEEKDTVSSFRMNSVLTTNDPKEGLTLLDFLKVDTNEYKFEEKHTAFVGCFTFNHNNLNQFRLYGKKDGMEGTGLSLVLNKNFFSPSMTNTFVGVETPKIESISPSVAQNNNLRALYRCIYIDPDVKEIVSLGHRDEYAFYLSGEGNKLKAYNTHINKILISVREAIGKLETFISGYTGEPAILVPLLLQLRYLVKHAAFKEEQECRILDIENIERENSVIKHDEKTGKIYIDYQKIKPENLAHLYFAPMAPEYKLFCSRLQLNGITAPCEKSKHPFS